MKVINYVCNRCGKQIDDKWIYTIVPVVLDADGESTFGIPDEVSDELFELVEDKHLCLECLKKTLKFFGAPAIPNTEFQKALKDMKRT